MVIFGILLQLMVNREAFLLSFGFDRENYMASLILFVYLYSVSLDIPIRIGLNAYSRLQEHQADLYTVQQGYGEPLQHALIRSHAISLDSLFLSYIDQLLVANHPSMQDRVKNI